jgi:hypothetical protein
MTVLANRGNGKAYSNYRKKTRSAFFIFVLFLNYYIGPPLLLFIVPLYRNKLNTVNFLKMNFFVSCFKKLLL